MYGGWLRAEEQSYNIPEWSDEFLDDAYLVVSPAPMMVDGNRIIDGGRQEAREAEEASIINVVSSIEHYNMPDGIVENCNVASNKEYEDQNEIEESRVEIMKKLKGKEILLPNNSLDCPYGPKTKKCLISSVNKCDKVGRSNWENNLGQFFGPKKGENRPAVQYWSDSSDRLSEVKNKSRGVKRRRRDKKSDEIEERAVGGALHEVVVELAKELETLMENSNPKNFSELAVTGDQSRRTQ